MKKDNINTHDFQVPLSHAEQEEIAKNIANLSSITSITIEDIVPSTFLEQHFQNLYKQNNIKEADKNISSDFHQGQFATRQSRYESFKENFHKKRQEANKKPVDIETLYLRMSGFLRYLLLDDSASMQSREITHTDTEYLNGIELVPDDTELNHTDYLAKLESFYTCFINNTNRIENHLAYFDYMFFKYKIILPDEITERNYQQVINEFCKTMTLFYQVLQARTMNNFLLERSLFSTQYIQYPFSSTVTTKIHVSDTEAT